MRMAAFTVAASSFNIAMAKLEDLRFLGPLRYFLLIFVLIFGKIPFAYESFQYKKISNWEPRKCVVDEVEGKIIPCECCQKQPDGTDEEPQEWSEVSGIPKHLVGSIAVDVQRMIYAIQGVKDSLPSPQLADGVGLAALKQTVRMSRALKRAPT